MHSTKHSLLSVLDLDAEALAASVQRGLELKSMPQFPRPLVGRIVGQIFTRPSTRTRTAFFCAATRLGASVIHYDGTDLQLGNGESLEDTAMALSNHLDIAVVRTNGPHHALQVMREHGGRMALINALCEREHPTQAIADLITMREEFGDLSGRHLVYVGLPCNTMNSLVLACAMVPGLRVTVLTPDKSPPESWLREEVRRLVAGEDRISFASDWAEVEAPADVVYATRWESMGVAPEFADWREARKRLLISSARIEAILSRNGIFLHDLPATRGGEVESAVLDGPRSRIWNQSLNKAISAAVALERAAGKQTGAEFHE